MVVDPMPASADKATLRREMRRIRNQISDREIRSARIWEYVVEVPAVRVAERILAFSSIPGEPDTTPLQEWATAHGVEVRVPEDDVAASWPDVVIVPGVAYTAGGDRLGQGGGWYDRFLAAVRPDCTTIGVCFAAQVVPTLPVEPHDIAVDLVVTDAGPAS